MIGVTCPGCGNEFNVADSQAGKQGRCLRCGAVVIAPAPWSAPADSGLPVAGAPNGFCSTCGAPRVEGAAFCSGCGMRVGESPSHTQGVATTRFTSPPTAPPSAPLYPPSQPGQKRLGLPTWVLILILIPCIGALLFGGAVCTAIAVPTFAGQRVKAQDAAAKSLVRNAMTSAESQFVDSKTFDTPTALPAAHEIDPKINFRPLAYDSATGTPRVEARTKETTVAYDGKGAMYVIATVSETGKIWGVSVDKGAGGGTEFFCVETDGSYRTGW